MHKTERPGRAREKPFINKEWTQPNNEMNYSIGSVAEREEGTGSGERHKFARRETLSPYQNE